MQDANLNIRINKETRDKFLACVAKSEFSYSKLIRDFIEKYIEEHEENKWSSLSLTKNHFLNFL